MNEDAVIWFEATVHSVAPPHVVYGVVANPSSHLEWAGRQAPDESFRLLTMQAPDGVASVGTTFSSTGAASRDAAMMFHDRSTVTEATPPVAFGFETDANLMRKHRPTWQARFVHRYTLAPDASGTRVKYTCAVYPQNYRPYWLHPLTRPVTRRVVSRAMRRNLQNLMLLQPAPAVPVNPASGGVD